MSIRCRRPSRGPCCEPGDWVTPHLDGIKYFEKPPLKYWLMAIAFKLSAYPMWRRASRWRFHGAALLAHCADGRLGVRPENRTACGGGSGHGARTISIYRVLISDVALTFTIALAMWAFLRALDEQEPQPAAVGPGLWRQRRDRHPCLRGLSRPCFRWRRAFCICFSPGKLLRRETWRRLLPAAQP